MRTIWKRQPLLCITAAAAFTSSSQAWVPPTTTTFTRGITSTRSSHLVPPCHESLLSSSSPSDHTHFHGPTRQPQRPQTRMFSSKKEEGFLEKLGNTVKSFLPTKLFGSQEEKQALARKQEYRDQVSGGLDTMLKDAPLGVRMLGKMMSPLVSSMASSLAETVAEQQRTMEQVMDDARGYLMGDPAATALLGEPISLGPPFSQASSTSTINGKTQSRVELAMPVSGSRGSGTVQVLATQDGISQMLLDAGGRRINVSLSRRGGGGNSYWSSAGSGRVNGDDNIIEAEVIDKNTK